jgi:hypothetical protein
MFLYRVIFGICILFLFNNVCFSPCSVEATENYNRNAAWQVREFAEMVTKKNDNKQRPFIVVDKKQATIYVYDADGVLLGKAPVLLGMAVGDELPIEIARRPLSQIKPPYRITPAGRYIAEIGRDTHGQEVLWVDFSGNLAIHPVINVPKQRRLERLKSQAIDDNRISWGCINVPKMFFKKYIGVYFSRTKGMVYILPEVESINKYLWFEK